MAANEPMLGRVWAPATRCGPPVACAWLIRRFIDPEATMLWLGKGQVALRGARLRLRGAHFGNSGSRVTYEERLARTSLAQNPALAKIGNIVHFLEIRGTPVPGGGGAYAAAGLGARCTSDDDLLRETERTFAALRRVRRYGQALRRSDTRYFFASRSSPRVLLAQLFQARVHRRQIIEVRGARGLREFEAADRRRQAPLQDVELRLR